VTTGPQLLRHARGVLDLAQPVVMGVLNVTPDSFSDGGRFLDAAHALGQAQRMEEEGAAIIDIGAESTRPGAAPVPAAEQLARLLPVIQPLARRSRVLISVDTSDPEVIEAAVAEGAALVNDVRALKRPGALEAVARTRAAACLMHMRGEPATMQLEARYDDVVGEVRSMLAGRIRACQEAGIEADRLLVDPGFGFAKLAEHNLRLLRELRTLATLGVPLLVGLSRKSMLQALTGRAHGERLAGSVALAAIAVWQGAAVVRAHDVAATVDAVRVAAALRPQLAA
jgi:dihydropteroate synthase